MVTYELVYCTINFRKSFPNLEIAIDLKSSTNCMLVKAFLPPSPRHHVCSSCSGQKGNDYIVI